MSFGMRNNVLFLVVMWFKACGHFIAGIVVLNPAEDINVHLFVVCCVCSGFCHKLIALSEESYWLCVSYCL